VLLADLVFIADDGADALAYLEGLIRGDS